MRTILLILGLWLLINVCDHDAPSQATVAGSTSAATVDRSIGCNQTLSEDTAPLKKSDDCAVI